MSSTVSFFAAKNIGEKEKLVNNSRGNQNWIFYYKQKIQKKLLAVKKKIIPWTKNILIFWDAWTNHFFFLLRKNGKKIRHKKTEFLP